MIYLKFFFLLLLSCTFSMDFASKIAIEEIIGGYPALQSEFKYQAAIVGKYNYSSTMNLLCSAGIISNYLLISAARCFLYVANELRKLRFYAVVGSDVLIAKDLKLKEIEKIYTYYYSDLWFDHNLAIVRLEHSLFLENRRDLVALEIPCEEETFYGQRGVITGFGVDSISNIKNNQHREQIRIVSRKGLFLKHAIVEIVHGGESGQSVRGIENEDIICGEVIRQFTELCGTMLPDDTYEHRGTCMGDLGAPLVIGNKVVGLASKHRKDCDDTKHGTVYIKVSRFKHFIDGILQATHINYTSIYINPTFVPGSKSRRGATSRS